jgi:hypothetical protein
MQLLEAEDAVARAIRKKEQQSTTPVVPLLNLQLIQRDKEGTHSPLKSPKGPLAPNANQMEVKPFSFMEAVRGEIILPRSDRSTRGKRAGSSIGTSEEFEDSLRPTPPPGRKASFKQPVPSLEISMKDVAISSQASTPDAECEHHTYCMWCNNVLCEGTWYCPKCGKFTSPSSIEEAKLKVEASREKDSTNQSSQSKVPGFTIETRKSNASRNQSKQDSRIPLTARQFTKVVPPSVQLLSERSYLLSQMNSKRAWKVRESLRRGEPYPTSRYNNMVAKEALKHSKEMEANVISEKLKLSARYVHAESRQRRASQILQQEKDAKEKNVKNRKPIKSKIFREASDSTRNTSSELIFESIVHGRAGYMEYERGDEETLTTVIRDLEQCELRVIEAASKGVRMRLSSVQNISL